MKKEIPIYTLQEWILVEIGSERRIRGKIYGHPKYIDGTSFVTGVLRKYHKIGSYAIDKEAFYNLEEEKNYKRKKTHKDEEKEDD